MTETNIESKSGYEVFLETLNKVKDEDNKHKMRIIKDRLNQFKQKYYEFKKSPCLNDCTLRMYVDTIEMSKDSLKELERFLILEEGWPPHKIGIVSYVKHNGHFKITFKISEII